MDSSGLLHEIQIELAYDYARMVGLLPMEPDEVAAIQRDHCPAFTRGKSKHFLVGLGLIGLARFLNRQHVVTQRAQSLNHRQGKILVGIKPRHQSASFASIWLETSSRCERT